MHFSTAPKKKNIVGGFSVAAPEPLTKEELNDIFNPSFIQKILKEKKSRDLDKEKVDKESVSNTVDARPSEVQAKDQQFKVFNNAYLSPLKLY